MTDSLKLRLVSQTSIAKRLEHLPDLPDVEHSFTSSYDGHKIANLEDTPRRDYARLCIWHQGETILGNVPIFRGYPSQQISHHDT